MEKGKLVTRVYILKKVETMYTFVVQQDCGCSEIKDVS